MWVNLEDKTFGTRLSQLAPSLISLRISPRDMAPFVQHLFARELDPGVSSEEFRNQWKHPHDVFVVLLILGGDVVGRALAQLAGSWVTPVAFSFGTTSLMSRTRKFPQDTDSALRLARRCLQTY